MQKGQDGYKHLRGCFSSYAPLVNFYIMGVQSYGISALKELEGKEKAKTVNVLLTDYCGGKGKERKEIQGSNLV